MLLGQMGLARHLQIKGGFGVQSSDLGAYVVSTDWVEARGGFFCGVSGDLGS